MFDAILKLLKDKKQDDGAGHDPLHLATAALLVDVAFVDGHASDAELGELKACLASEFGLADSDIDPLIAEARTAASAALDRYQFTRVISQHVDQEGRQAIVKLLWRVALADSVIENFEANLLAKVAGLLGVRPEDRVRLKQEVEAERRA